MEISQTSVVLYYLRLVIYVQMNDKQRQRPFKTDNFNQDVTLVMTQDAKEDVDIP